MQITLLCTSERHPVNPWLQAWSSKNSEEYDIRICRDRSELSGGDVLFLISCSQIIDAEARSKYRHTLVLHASDLPEGRGWSPHVWALLGGAREITVTLLDADDGVDTGAVWVKKSFPVAADALHDEVDRLLFDVELNLMDTALRLISTGALPSPQASGLTPVYYRKRSPADSEIDPSKPLSELFNKIRLMDPDRYPAFFSLHGHVYTIRLKKVR
ncbi:formyltransferase family protein [Halomonas sp.]|uniref:formyltransferase family protein n=1 Tax=Halomonas sp. TaxID=1486246 RepID=UPI003A8F0DD5